MDSMFQEHGNKAVWESSLKEIGQIEKETMTGLVGPYGKKRKKELPVAKS